MPMVRRKRIAMNIRLTSTLDDFPADVPQIPYSGLESIDWARCGTFVEWLCVDGNTYAGDWTGTIVDIPATYLWCVVGRP